MFKPRKIGAGLYRIDTELGEFDVNGYVQGYGDFGWVITYPNDSYSDPFPTKREAYLSIRLHLAEASQTV